MTSLLCSDSSRTCSCKKIVFAELEVPPVRIWEFIMRRYIMINYRINVVYILYVMKGQRFYLLILYNLKFKITTIANNITLIWIS